MVWTMIDETLAAKAAPMFAVLRAAATEADIAQAEASLGFAFPSELRDAHLTHDGQQPDWETRLPFLGEYHWFSLKQIVQTHRMQMEILGSADVVADDSSAPDQKVRYEFWNPRWLPVAGTSSGQLLFLDFAPGPAGSAGQVVCWDAVEGARQAVFSESFQALIDGIVDALSLGKITYSEHVDPPGWASTKSGQRLDSLYWISHI